jgi:glycosyltransferase involved in cell wall biosynthesis
MVHVTAIIACRNEERYLGNCLTYLAANGISFAVIDNQSSSATREIIDRAALRPFLAHYEVIPFDGVYRWERLLARKVELAETLGTEWVIHHDADEVMHSYRDETLAEAIARIAATGADVIDMDEFVFLPVDHAYMPDFTGPQPMRHYYFFQPSPHRLMRAWKTGRGFSMVEAGGHTLTGSPHVLAKESFALRHYPFANQHHALRKYQERRFDQNELARGWHGNRYNQPKERFIFPDSKLGSVPR